MTSEQPFLFQLPRPTEAWRPPTELPDLSRHRKLWCDTETNGLNPRRSTICGLSVYTEDRKKYYLPTNHLGGGNLDTNQVTRWACSTQGLAGKELTFLNAKGDFHYLRNSGINLEALGCKLRDVSFKAALLNDNRGYKGLDLDSLAYEYRGLRKDQLGKQISKDKMAETHSSEVGPYAERDAELVFLVDDTCFQHIKAENLQQVLDLEDSLIYCVAHMEMNGLKLDIPKLERWQGELQAEYSDLIMGIWRDTGMRVNPDSPPHLKALLAKLGLETGYTTEGGEESYTAYALEKLKHPVIAKVLRARRVASLLSKYIRKFLNEQENGVLYYSLHQLKSDREGYGTVSGRFSGTNMSQQIMKTSKQIVKFGPTHLIRECIIPENGCDIGSSDAKQIEFRLFVHYSGSRRLQAYYERDPNTDFHNIVMDNLKSQSFLKLEPKPRRERAKKINFSVLYGLSNADNAAEQLECSPEEAQEAMDDYDRDFPEAKRLFKYVSNLAARRGYVRTVLNRRARFPDKKRLHSALNRVIQGTAAELNKIKLKETYDNRETLGIRKMRLTLHDEIVVDILKDPSFAGRWQEMLDTQSVKLSVPVLWDTGTGKNWKEAGE